VVGHGVEGVEASKRKPPCTGVQRGWMCIRMNARR
jgi:hypothetical protein